MRRETSIYLNAVRFFAALVVFLGHTSGRRFTDGFLWAFGEYMDVAVIIFFVLSGYVIAYVTDNRERTLDDYAINRVARILSVAIPALILTFVLDTIGRSFHPEAYSAAWGYSSDQIWLQYLDDLSRPLAHRGLNRGAETLTNNPSAAAPGAGLTVKHLCLV